MTHRVLWLTKGLGLGGAERLLVSTATYLDRDRVRPDVAYVLPRKDALVPQLREAGITVRCLGESGTASGWVGALRSLIREGDYDLIHTHAPVPAVAARAVTPRCVPMIHTEHNVWPRYRIPTRWANAASIGRNELVIAVSNGVAESIRAPLPLRLMHLPEVAVLIHGIDPAQVRIGPEARATARGRLGIRHGDRVIGTVGNLTPKKDHATMIRAFARLAGDLDGVHLVIIGSGPLENDIRGLVKHYALHGRVHMLGMRSDVPELLPALDVFCMSSLHEGLSIALVEALAAGVPAVATNVGGIPEAIRHDREGLLVPAGDPGALAEALRRVLVDVELRSRLAETAVERAADFSIEGAVRATEDIYDRVLQACRTV